MSSHLIEDCGTLSFLILLERYIHAFQSKRMQFLNNKMTILKDYMVEKIDASIDVLVKNKTFPILIGNNKTLL